MKLFIIHDTSSYDPALLGIFTTQEAAFEALQGTKHKHGCTCMGYACPVEIKEVEANVIWTEALCTV